MPEWMMKENLLRFNRKKLIVEIYAKDAPSFVLGVPQKQLQDTIHVPSPEQVQANRAKAARPPHMSCHAP